MNDKDLKNIYEYMSKRGWELRYLHGVYPDYSEELDSNSAYECVQEMGRRGDWGDFLDTITVDKDKNYQFVFWFYNPDNFFNCMAKWLEVRNES